MIKEIRALDPKPGLAFGASPAQPIVPDVFVRPPPDGTWHVELNSDTLPRVLVNQAYYAKVSKSAREVDAKSYLSECMQTATWLVKALDQRAKTVMKVVFGNRAPAGRVLRPWRAPSAPAQSQDRGRRDCDA